MKKILILLLVLVLTSCSGSNPIMKTQTSIAKTETAKPTLTATLIPTATLTLTPTSSPTPTATPIPKMEDVLIKAGFVQIPGIDGVDTCEVGECKVFNSDSDGIKARINSNGNIFMIVKSDNQYNSTTQRLTLSRVITPIYGVDVLTWIIFHLPISKDKVQEGFINGFTVQVFSFYLGTDVNLIAISRNNGSN